MDDSNVAQSKARATHGERATALVEAGYYTKDNKLGDMYG